MLKRGSPLGFSFGFSVAREDRGPGGLIKRVRELFEASVTPYRPTRERARWPSIITSDAGDYERADPIFRLEPERRERGREGLSPCPRERPRGDAPHAQGN